MDSNTVLKILECTCTCTFGGGNLMMGVHSVGFGCGVWEGGRGIGVWV